MARKKSTTSTTQINETGNHPTQSDIGGLIAAAINLHGDAIVTTLLENSEDLEISRDQLQSIANLIKGCTSKTRDATLNQLINLY